MQTLKAVLNNTLNTVKEQEHQVVEFRSSLINADGKAIMEKAKQLTVKNQEEVLTLLTQYVDFLKTPTFKEKTIFTEYGTDFVPIKVEYEAEPEQENKAREILAIIDKPLESGEFARLYGRLRLSIGAKADNDEKERMKVYYNFCKEYPANIMRKVFSKNYRFFPTLFELEEQAKDEIETWRLIKKGFKL